MMRAGRAERRHRPTRVLGHAFLAWCSSWGMVVYINFITTAENSNSSQLDSLSGQQVWQKGGRPCWASPLTFDLIGQEIEGWDCNCVFVKVYGCIYCSTVLIFRISTENSIRLIFCWGLAKSFWGIYKWKIVTNLIKVSLFRFRKSHDFKKFSSSSATKRNINKIFWPRLISCIQ